MTSDGRSEALDICPWDRCRTERIHENDLCVLMGPIVHAVALEQLARVAAKIERCTHQLAA